MKILEFPFPLAERGITSLAPRCLFPFCDIPFSVYCLQRIFAASQTDLFRVLQCFLPAYIRIAVHKVIAMIMEVRISKMIAKLRIPDRLRLQSQIHTGLIQGNRIEGGQHTDVRKNRSIIFSVAVTVR